MNQMSRSLYSRLLSKSWTMCLERFYNLEVVYTVQIVLLSFVCSKSVLYCDLHKFLIVRFYSRRVQRVVRNFHLVVPMNLNTQNMNIKMQFFLWTEGFAQPPIFGSRRSFNSILYISEFIRGLLLHWAKRIIPVKRVGLV